MSSNLEFAMESKLIQLVKQQKILYDLSHPSYKNNSARKMAWARLAPEVGLSSKEVQAKWRGLKSRYREALNSRECRSGGSPKPMSKKNLFLITEMDYFKSYFVDNTPTTSNIDEWASDSAISELLEHNTSSSNSNFQDLFDSTAESLDDNEYQSVNFIPPPASSPSGSSVKRKRSQSEDTAILHNLLETMKGHNQLVSQNNQRPPTCHCQNVDSFFISLGEECKSIDKKYSIELKIAMMNIAKFFVEKSQVN